jgi:hypothetical protein
MIFTILSRRMGAKQETYSDEEIARRRDEALLRALNTPPKRHSEMKLGRKKQVVESRKSDSIPAKKKGGRRPSKHD